MITTKNLAWLAAALLLTTASACGTDDVGSAVPAPVAPDSTTPPAGDAPPPSDPPSATTPTPTPTAPPCVGKAALAGDLDWTMKVDGKNRTVHVHVPTTYHPETPVPVVMSFHGYTSNGVQQNLLAHMSEKADAAGFIAVHAEGVGISQSWNAGACCGDAASSAIDDVGFVGKIIDEVESKLCVDAHRVYATGMSNGGFLSHRLACELSNRIAAVAPVAGVLGIPTCNPTRPMSVFQFHGTLDALVAYGGSPSKGFPSVAQTLSGWAGRSGCSLTPRETSKKGEVTCVTYDNCKAGAEVNLCTVAGGGHTWPGGLLVPSLGHTTMDIVATDAMWDFFMKHPLP